MLQDSVLPASVVLSVDNPDIEGSASGRAIDRDEVACNPDTLPHADNLSTASPQRTTIRGASGDEEPPTTQNQRKRKRGSSYPPNDAENSVFWDKINEVLRQNNAVQDYAYGFGVMVVARMREKGIRWQRKFARKCMDLMEDSDEDE